MSFDSIESTGSMQSNLISEISIMSLEDNYEDILESTDEAEIFEESEDPRSKSYTEFPNDAYKDLMILVTKHKLNNKAGNDIIRFFNKYSTLTKSPLPKNIEKGRVFMNNMNFSNLEFCKVHITNHKGKDYYLYYQNLIKCIKNILSVPDITQDFALSCENYEVNIVNLNHLIIFILIDLYLIYSVIEKVFTKNKILEHGGRLRKNLYLLVPNYYQLFYIRMPQPRIH